MFLTLIIPVYNAEKYLPECLDSLLAQDLPAEDFEIICVNDGSKDGSLSVLQTYADKYPNIRIIDKENGGVTTARNAGLEAAQGAFIWFIDADDLIKENILAQLKAMVPETGCDRVVFGAYEFMDALTEEELEKSRKKELTSNTSWYDAVVWRSLLRTEFLRQHNLYFRYPELTHGEDGMFMYEVTLADPITVATEEVLYFYRIHSGSADASVSVESLKKKLRSHVRITQILQQHFLAQEIPAEGSANKMMIYLWKSMYEATQLPYKDAHAALQGLREAGLFPCRRPKECTMTTSFMTDRTDLVGRVFDKVYLNLHTRLGYMVMRLLQKLR